MSYYWFNREKILNNVREKYQNKRVKKSCEVLHC